LVLRGLNGNLVRFQAKLGSTGNILMGDKGFGDYT